MDNSLENQIIKLVDDFINTMIEMHNTVPGQEDELYALAEGQLLELTDKALMILGGREEYLETMLSQLITQKLPQGAVIDCFGNFKEEMDQVVARTLEVYHQQQLDLVSGTDTWGDASEDEVEEESVDLESVMEASQEEAEVDDAGDDVASAGEYNEFEEDDEADNLETLEKSAEASPEKTAKIAWEPVDVDGIEGVAFEPVEAQIPAEEALEEDPLGILVRLAFPGQEILRNYSIHDIVVQWFVPDLELGFLSPEEGDFVSSMGDLALRRAGITLIIVDPAGIYNVKSFKRSLRRLLLEKNSEDKGILDLSAE